MSAVKEAIDELGLEHPHRRTCQRWQTPHFRAIVWLPSPDHRIETEHPLFRLLTQIQDEVHRFAITFHRDKRSKRQIASALDEIKGIGEKTKSTLLKEFKSVKRIREASAEELAAVVGEAKAKIIQTYFSEK